jgi:hypothetical protein
VRSKKPSEEAAGAVDAGFVQIEWSEEGVLELTEVGTEVEEVPASVLQMGVSS